MPLLRDFAGVEYVSSVGLRVLMLAAKQVKAQRSHRHCRADAGSFRGVPDQPF